MSGRGDRKELRDPFDNAEDDRVKERHAEVVSCVRVGQRATVR
jgi:hypothetical protein